MFGAIGEIRGMNQAECHRRQHVFLFPPSRDFTDQGRGVPFTEERDIAFRIEPFLQEGDLRAFAGAIDSLNDKELSGESVFPVHFHGGGHQLFWPLLSGAAFYLPGH
jgi:hypothetical protein